MAANIVDTAKPVTLQHAVQSLVDDVAFHFTEDGGDNENTCSRRSSNRHLRILIILRDGCAAAGASSSKRSDHVVKALCTSLGGTSSRYSRPSYRPYIHHTSLSPSAAAATSLRILSAVDLLLPTSSQDGASHHPLPQLGAIQAILEDTTTPHTTSEAAVSSTIVVLRDSFAKLSDYSAVARMAYTNHFRVRVWQTTTTPRFSSSSNNSGEVEAAEDDVVVSGLDFDPIAERIFCCFRHAAATPPPPKPSSYPPNQRRGRQPSSSGGGGSSSRHAAASIHHHQQQQQGTQILSIPISHHHHKPPPSQPPTPHFNSVAAADTFHTHQKQSLVDNSQRRLPASSSSYSTLSTLAAPLIIADAPQYGIMSAAVAPSRGAPPQKKMVVQQQQHQHHSSQQYPGHFPPPHQTYPHHPPPPQQQHSFQPLQQQQQHYFQSQQMMHHHHHPSSSSLQHQQQQHSRQRVQITTVPGVVHAYHHPPPPLYIT